MNPVELQEKEELLRLHQERKRLIRSNGSAFYEPHHKQDLFHQAGECHYRFVRTGNRWGKSQCGSVEDVAWARGFREWYPEGHPARYAGIPARSTKGVILVYDWGKAEEIFTNMVEGKAQGKLFNYIPQADFLGVEKNNAGSIEKIKIQSKWGGVSTIHLDTVKSFIQNPMAHESSEWDWVHVDEPIPQEMWQAYARGLMDNNGKAWFLCTPLSEPWINDFFIPSRRTELSVTEGNVFTDTLGGKYERKKYVIIGSTKDNPHISEEARLAFEKDLSEDEKACRLEGIPKAMSGMVYKAFKHETAPEGHTYSDTPKGWESPIKPPKNYTLRYAIDPHPRTPHAVLFAATAPTGEVYFFSEIFRACLISDLAESIHSIIDGYDVASAICDPIAFIANPVTGDTMADTLVANGIFVDKASKDLSRGILATQVALKEKMPQGHYKMLFYEGLPETIYEFDHYTWDPKGGNKPVDKDDHMMECLYRLVLNGLDYIDPTDEFGSHFDQINVTRVDLSRRDYVYQETDKRELTPEEKYELWRLGV